MAHEYTEIDRLLDRYLEIDSTGNSVSDLTQARQAINDYVAAKDAEITELRKQAITSEIQDVYDFYKYRKSLPQPINNAEIELYSFRLWGYFLAMMEARDVSLLPKDKVQS